MKAADSQSGLELLQKAIPYPNQILNLEVYKDKIYFDWRSNRYRLELYGLSIMMVKGIALEGNDCSILLSKLIENEFDKSNIKWSVQPLPKQTMKKKYKLLKDLPDVKAGEFFELGKDMDAYFLTSNKTETKFNCYMYPANFVENNTEWFELVDESKEKSLDNILNIIKAIRVWDDDWKCFGKSNNNPAPLNVDNFAIMLNEKYNVELR